MKMMLAVGVVGAFLAGAADAQSIPASPSAAHSQLAAVVGGSGFHDGWAMHLPSPRTTDFEPGVRVSADGECASVVSGPAGSVRFDWRQAARIRSAGSLRPVSSPMGPRIPLEYVEVSFGAESPALRLFFKTEADRDRAAAAARYLGQRCNAAGFSVDD